MDNTGKRPQRRILLGIAAVVLLAVVVSVGIGLHYVFGGKSATPSGTVTAATLVPTKNGTVFTIDQSASKVTFTMHEVLFGNPNTVVGTTNLVAGQIAVDLNNPSQSQVGQIKIDLSGLKTDNDFRNSAIQGQILETGQPGDQFATFDPTAISGLPATITTGQQISFQIMGNLTIHSVQKAETFAVQATLVNGTTLTGIAKTTVKYEDFNITIPPSPSVANVGDTVNLELDFTAHT